MTTAAVKERPLLFSAPMVRALLKGTKTQTRRRVKLDRWMVTAGMSLVGATRDPGMGDGEYLKVPNIADGTRHRLYCPYGVPGERLWVKETCFDNDNGGEWIYRADGEFDDQFEMVEGDPKWTPSIHCPRRASRILLEITEVRVERLRDISGCDCLAEGVEVDTYDVVGPGAIAMRTVRALNAYRALWDEINGAGAWAANPWVWVLTIRRVTP